MMASESSEKRGRGRPKGSLNKATVAKQEQMRAATTLDVSFESAEDVPVELESPPSAGDETKTPSPRERLVSMGEEEVPVSIIEPDSMVEPEEPPEPKPKRKARKPKIPEVVPEDEEEAPVREVKKRKPRATTVPRDPEPPLTYLQVLQRGLAAANATQKAERVQRYDAYFSHL